MLMRSDMAVGARQAEMLPMDAWCLRRRLMINSEAVVAADAVQVEKTTEWWERRERERDEWHFYLLMEMAKRKREDEVERSARDGGTEIIRRVGEIVGVVTPGSFN